ncbi:MAG: hypothetical protein K9M45_09115, partial [Kiritimatiellales bacterium]|nr:hypothetical protein [Kiritimatiellales bacterium]
MTLSLRLIWEDLRKEFGERIEPFESWRNADDLRKYWRPENVKVVLFAESHVFTKLDEMSIRVQHSRFTDDPIPDSFVKLVYCLGYGENELLSQCLESNFGTRQFWEIFYSGLHRVESTSDFVSIRKTKTRNLDDRIQNKLEILREMKALGIWLLDASLAALYPKTHLPGGMYQACMQKSWPYVSALIAEANPERIVVIGKTMWRTFLCHQLPSLGIPCFLQSQPQARMTTQERMEMFGNYYDLFHGNGCFEQTSCKKESKQPANKTKRQASKDKGASCEWTLNGRHG